MSPSEVSPLLRSQKSFPESTTSTCAASESSFAGSTVRSKSYPPDHAEDPACKSNATLDVENGDVQAEHLKPSDATSEQPSPASPPGCSATLLLVLLFSLLTSNVEGSLLLTTHARIASELGGYSKSQWLIIAYPLAVSAAEPIMGSLSDGIGRKRLLLISYVLFALAASLCGAASHFAVFIVGRAVAGVGGSGLFGMINLIVSDLVGPERLPTYRGYLQAAMASGRVLGGPVGGLLIERCGWRLVFLAQTPVLLLATLCCAILIPSTTTPLETGHDGCRKTYGTGEGSAEATAVRHRLWKSVRHVDFCGALLLVCTITLGLLSMHALSDGYSVHDARVPLMLGLSLASGACLFIVERFLVSRPMLSRTLLTNPVVVGVYALATLGIAAQSSIIFTLPIEVQILDHATIDKASLQLMPLVICSVAGSIVAGMLITRGANLDLLSSMGTTTAALATVVIHLCWSSLHPLSRILCLVVMGLGTSVTFATTFITLNDEVTRTDQAMAVSSLFCLYGVGSAFGTTASKLLIDSTLRWSLVKRLDAHDLHASKIISSLMDDYDAIHKMPESLQRVVRESFRAGFSASRAFSSALLLASLPCLLLLRWKSARKGAV